MYGYAREKLFDAVSILSTFPGDVRSRILHAYHGFHPLTEKHFPDDLKEDWNWIYNSITKFGPVYNHEGKVISGSVENTMRKIKNNTGTKIADKIFELFYRLHFMEEYVDNNCFQEEAEYD